MIINKKRKIIFVKTKKTAGTSFEIALSKFCDSDDVITPITPKDERMRLSLGYKGAQNYQNYFWREFSMQVQGHYFNHMPLSLIKQAVPNRVFQDYKKMTIYRNPYETAVSRYYWEGGLRTGYNFIEYLLANTNHLTENETIAPTYGDVQCDIFLRYEALQQDMELHGLGDVWNVFKNIRAKSDKRPKVGATVSEVYREFPNAVEIVRKCCAKEIDFFNYASPF